MKKSGPNALWNKLSAEQRETLDKWLFEQKLSYTKALAKAKSELGFEGSESSLKRYYKRREQERMVENLSELIKDAAEIKGESGDGKLLREGTMKMIAAQAFQQVRKEPEKVKKWGALVKLMVDNDRNETVREEHEVRRELKREDQKLRKEALEFAKEKFEFNMVKRALKALPELKKLAEAKEDPDGNIRRYRENAHWNRARQAMFGLGAEVLPENATEEAEMLEARRARGEKGLEEHRIIEVQPPPPSSPNYQQYLKDKARKIKEAGL